MCGLGDDLKRKQIFMHLRTPDTLICLQETHATEAIQDMWRNDWGGEIYWSHGVSDARGVAILIPKNSEFEPLKHSIDDAGRYQLLQFSYGSEKFVLVNIYAPNRDTPQFFSEVINKMMDIEGKKIIVGDYNLILDNKIDRTEKTTGANVNNDKSKEFILKFLEEANFCDMWRDRYPDRRCYTRRRTRPVIDFFLMEQTLSGWVEDIAIKPSFKSDHSILECKIHPYNVRRGKGVWTLNNSVLKEKEYCALINQVLEKGSIDGLGLNPSDKWENVKLEVIEKSMEYCSKRAQDRNIVVSQMEEYLNKLEKDEDELTESERRIFEKTKIDYESIMEDKARGARLRAKSRWYNEAEKNTKYFYSLEKCKSGAKNVVTLIDKNEKNS